MARHRRSTHRRTRRPPKPAPLNLNALQLAVSILFFAASSAFFLYQCLAPHAKSRIALSHRPVAPVSTHVPQRNWFAHVQPGPVSARAPPPAAAPAPARTAASAPGHAPRAAAPGGKPRRWFAPAAPTRAPRRAVSIESIPDGPQPLPALMGSGGTHGARAQGSVRTETAGSSWTASLAQGIMSALPLHWRAEVAHALPRKDASGGTSVDDNSDSIFAGRRKAAWMGCVRPFHMVCKGVYRAIKLTDSIHVVDLTCGRNVGWLPHIVRKLRTEFRLVQLTCAVPSEDKIEGLRTEYAFVPDVKFVKLDPFVERFPNDTDMVIAYRFLEKENLIRAMRFFKNVKASGTVRLLTTESYPEEENVPKSVKVADKSGITLRLNTGVAPFAFPAPVFEYENEDENSESIPMQISTVKVDDVFQEKSTPDMEDLVDPRKRRVVE